METIDLICEKVEQVFSLEYSIHIYRRINGKHFAMTKFSESDVIISDGDSIEDTLNRHTRHLSIALSASVRQETYNRHLMPAGASTQP